MMVPYADVALLRFPDKDQAMDHMLELAYLTDRLPLPPPRTHHACNAALRILSLLPSLSADLPAALVVEWILTDRNGRCPILLRPRYNLLLSSVTINRWH